MISPAGLACFQLLNAEGKSGCTFKLEVVSLLSVSLPLTPTSEAAVACSALAAFQLLPGRSQLLGKELQPPLQQKEALLGAVFSCFAGSSTALLRSCNMKKVLSCDGQVTLKEQHVGISQLMNCQCHHRELSHGHSSVRGREGTSRDLSGLFLMKAASVPDMESWSHSRGIQEADTELLLISVALISLHSCLQKCLKERLSGRVL